MANGIAPLILATTLIFTSGSVAVIGGVESFSAGTVQADDITCLVIRRNRSL
jgi:hypothetical protein